MGKRGPKPKPTALKLLSAKYPNCSHYNHNEPQPEKFIDVPEPPEWCPLSDKARELWDSAAAVLINMGVFTEADTFLLARYCDMWPEWLKAREDCRRYGHDNVFLEDDPLNPGQRRIKHTQPHSWSTRFFSLSKAMQSIEAELGFSPASRSSIQVFAQNKQDDPVDSFLASRIG